MTVPPNGHIARILASIPKPPPVAPKPLPVDWAAVPWAEWVTPGRTEATPIARLGRPRPVLRLVV